MSVTRENRRRGYETLRARLTFIIIQYNICYIKPILIRGAESI